MGRTYHQNVCFVWRIIMLSRAQWNRFERSQESLVVVSTVAGQNVINGVRRPMTNVHRPTISNPHGCGMTIVRPRGQNPLLVAPKSALAPVSESVTANNGIRLNRSRYSPMTFTFGDCVRHVPARPLSL
jgi:hypothetical protein